MIKKRLLKWKKSSYILTFLSGKDDKRLKIISRLQANASKYANKDNPKFSSFGIISTCRELIFDVKDSTPVFHAIMYSLDTDKVSIRLEHMLDILIDNKNGEQGIDDEVRNILAIAAGLEIPVFPNSDKVAPLLAKYHRRMLIDGFTAPDGKGGRIHLKLSRSPGAKINDPGLLSELDPTKLVSPADLILIREAVSIEMLKISGAKRLLLSLRSALSELETILESITRNEYALQRCLTDNPLLFGPEYIRVIPKHRLGAEYEMDYALERHSGLVDLIEIESSSLSLYNKNGDPSSHLIHAEQQVIDWLHWIETNNSYARKGLPGLLNPLGYVIIGRTNSLTEKDLERIQRRNAMFHGRIIILTYDQLAIRGKQLLQVLEDTGASVKGQSNSLGNRTLDRRHISKKSCSRRKVRGMNL